MQSYKSIRNIAVIAHVDHGKTTLVDAMLKQTHTFRDNQDEMTQDRIMDSNDLEREKGITILSKNTSIFYKDTKINIIDTPGHADFGGEVERVMNMADGALLIVDAAEGPLSQTKFVLKKALEAKLKIILVINKVDRWDAQVKKVIDDTENLFLHTVDDPELLDFPIIYAVGRDGKAGKDLSNLPDNIFELLDEIVKTVPCGKRNENEPFKMLVSSFERNEYLGKLAMGRVNSGKIKKGDFVSLLTPDSRLVGNFKIEKMYINEGMEKLEALEAESGEVIYIAGIKELEIGETLTDVRHQVALPTISITQPTLKASFGPNTSIFARDESRFLTSRELKERLHEEVETNMGLKLFDDEKDSIRMVVAGRGELHLAILIEKLRREGYAMEVGKPEVIEKIIDGKSCEPFSELTILIPEQYVGEITSELGKRKAQLLNMEKDENDQIKLIYKISERNALGLRSKMMTKTRGMAMISSLFIDYEPKLVVEKDKRNGVLIADKSGKALSFGLDIAQKRGITFVEPTEGVYEGQIVGFRPLEGDLEINVCKGKQLTNMRSAGNDDNIQLAPPVKYSLEECLDFIEEDELIDVTPKTIRLRKKLLTKVDRVRASR